MVRTLIFPASLGKHARTAPARFTGIVASFRCGSSHESGYFLRQLEGNIGILHHYVETFAEPVALLDVDDVVLP